MVNKRRNNKMLGTLKFLLTAQMKRSKLVGKTRGFTLIELLVAMILAVLVIIPLLAFTVNVLDNDRQELAKTSSQQEIQSALDYISRDLQQAIYIYDVNGVERDNSTTPENSGIKNQIPPVVAATNCSTTATCQPVLVFWKRSILGKDSFLGGSRVGTLTSITGSTAAGTGDDAAVFSLVAYYLIKDATCADTNTWSCTARIGRFEIRDGIPNPDASSVAGTLRTEGSNSVRYLLSPSLGFKRFNLQLLGTDVATKMNQWTKHSTEAYTDTPTPGGTQVKPQVQILADYIDQSATSPFMQACATTQRQVPSTLTGGFYTCVDTDNIIAQVFIRGNGLARVQGKTSSPSYNTSKSSYFPNAFVQVKGRGLLGVSNK